MIQVELQILVMKRIPFFVVEVRNQFGNFTHLDILWSKRTVIVEVMQIFRISQINLKYAWHISPV